LCLVSQGTLALADLTRSPSFDAAVQHCDLNVHSVLMAEGCLPAFLGCLQLQGDLDLLRASLTALANLSETQEQLCAQVLEDEKSLSCLYKLAGIMPKYDGQIFLQQVSGPGHRQCLSGALGARHDRRAERAGIVRIPSSDSRSRFCFYYHSFSCR